MTAYCPALNGSTEHTCLCTALANHIGGHRCSCGHNWGDPWHAMTYDEQREFLGLPDVSLQVSWDRIRLSMNHVREGFVEVGESMRRTFDALGRYLSEESS